MGGVRPALVRFDADVLVVGLGCAGAAAAFEAAAAGARVIALEAAGGPGGSSALSGGEVYLGGGTDLQHACGVEDDTEQMFRYLHQALGPHPDDAKLRLYCEGSPEHYRWLVERGVPFKPSLYQGVSWLPPTEDGLMWLGENAWPFTETAVPAPRGHRPATPGSGGQLLMECLVASARGVGVEVHTDTRARGLVTDASGAVVGVRARRFGEELSYHAPAVVLSTGGFADEESMVADHVPALVGHRRVSDGRDDGSGIRLGLSVGGTVRRMSATQIALSVVPALACHGMIVNARGERFVNEDVYPGRFSQIAVLHQPGPWFTVVDEQGWEAVPEAERWGVQPLAVSEDVAELEVAAGFPAGSLAATLARYGADAAAGADRVHHKDPRWLRPLRAPYAVIDATAGFGGSGPGGASGFTLGGLRTDLDGAVLDAQERPIQGLYAAGRAASGIHGAGYVSGTSLGDGTFFGRRAGRAATR
ncbi:FAD-dependent oxidoreductase [Nocardioides sp. BGMRC 2183]|nr:FAD-dependent oxidoreductase [Nocardioides sp. BGMRC 2183]